MGESKKEIKLDVKDLEVKNGKVIINSEELAKQVEGMNITGDSISGEEGSNAVVIWA